VLHNSIADFCVVAETSLTETCIKHQHISESHRNSNPPSNGTITTDRCLTHIRDAAHSENRVWTEHNFPSSGRDLRRQLKKSDVHRSDFDPSGAQQL